MPLTKDNETSATTIAEGSKLNMTWYLSNKNLYGIATLCQLWPFNIIFDLWNRNRTIFGYFSEIQENTVFYTFSKTIQLTLTSHLNILRARTPLHAFQFGTLHTWNRKFIGNASKSYRASLNRQNYNLNTISESLSLCK